MPRGTVESDLATWKKLKLFSAFTRIGLPDT
jgi:hypothetical protein